MRIETARLVFRRWQPDDVDALAALVTHADVVRWLPYGTRADVIAAIERYERSFEEYTVGRLAFVDRRTASSSVVSA
jgi:RimJ/RimL family protein N-acetyltransferase